MQLVWLVFSVTAVGILALALFSLRRRGDTAPAFRTAGRYLLLLAAGTALFPSMLPCMGPVRWAAAYVGFVVALTVVMIVAAIRRARAPSP